MSSERNLASSSSYNHTNSINDDRQKFRNLSEVIHIPPQFQRFNSSLDLPHAAAVVLRNSPSTSRTLVRSATDHYYIEINGQNSSNQIRSSSSSSSIYPTLKSKL